MCVFSGRLQVSSTRLATKKYPNGLMGGNHYRVEVLPAQIRVDPAAVADVSDDAASVDANSEDEGASSSEDRGGSSTAVLSEDDPSLAYQLPPSKGLDVRGDALKPHMHACTQTDTHTHTPTHPHTQTRTHRHVRTDTHRGIHTGTDPRTTHTHTHTYKHAPQSVHATPRSAPRSAASARRPPTPTTRAQVTPMWRTSLLGPSITSQ